ncbi:MAG TPA: hypothetical protein VNV64_04595, partial [Candidatus Binatia bacterium]|nr:hypothetical protein [Candidatus Binatia bacterium]
TTLPLRLLPLTLALALARARNRNRYRMIRRARRSRPTTALSSLRMAAETDNCASALWLL